MSDFVDKDIYDQGEQDGYLAGLSGRSRPPAAELQAEGVRPEFRKAYERGAEVGFARGREERDLMQNRAAHQMRKNEEERDR